MSRLESENLFENMDFEAKNNFVGFYALLLKIDKRVNPELYKFNEKNDNNRDTNIADQAE
ncbi:MAG: hypothetical protein WC860_09510 [Candidatus Margulisiibacteriota bacterium]|jgi:hypothetical protein